MTCDNCGREIRAYVPGQSEPPDDVRRTVIDGENRGMWCTECRSVAGLDARPIGTVLREMNGERKRDKRNARRKRQS